MSVPTPEELLTLTIPDGKFELTAEMHHGLLTHAHAPDLFSCAAGSPAHPIFAHLATHCGMGWTFNQFLAAVAATPQDGVVFGGGTFTYHSPPIVGASYLVHAVMDAVTRKQGRRVGVFDAITIRLELRDTARTDDTGGVVLVTTETYIVPRRTMSPHTETPTTPAPSSSRESPSLSARSSSPVQAVLQNAGRAGGYSVGPLTRDDIVGIMRVMDDTNPVHLDAELALASGYRGPVNQGPANLAYMFNAIAADRGRIDDLRFVSFTFRDTVTEGDRLEVLLTPSDPPGVDAELVILGIGTAVTCHAEFLGA